MSAFASLWGDKRTSVGAVLAYSREALATALKARRRCLPRLLVS
jgi:hypothetical protein